MKKYEKKTDRITKPEGKAAVIGSEDMERLFSHEEGFQSIRDRALFGICRFTACRINEACQLRSDDVFMPSGKVKKEIIFRASTTKGGYGGKAVKVCDELRQLLEEYGHPGKVQLFPGRHGLGHINPVSASNIFKEVCDRLDLDHVSTHSFRRTSINRLREAGYNLEEIKTVSGHKSMSGLAAYLEVTDKARTDMVSCL
ncbi:MAG: site-specific integrase [Timaviella obliquedivisa GSE-PSE-MK23-08B]|nr:site-specific integrase [Timaviella obliquedivisa GSE-PSE-MK23-08B]